MHCYNHYWNQNRDDPKSKPFSRRWKVELTKYWAKYLPNRIGFVKRKATTKAEVDIKEFKEIKKLFCWM